MILFSGQAEEWNRLIRCLPDPHILQTWDWAGIKEEFGWKAIPTIWVSPQTANAGEVRIQAAAMILKRIIPIRGFSARVCVLYVPKGPLLDWQDLQLRQRVLDDLQNFAREQRAVFIKMDPEIILGRGIPNTENQEECVPNKSILVNLQRRGWSFSNEQVQFRNTVVLDLSPSEEIIKSNFKQKTRYNLNLSSRKGMVVRTGTLDDLPLLYKMYAETSLRDGFVIRNENYYHVLWKAFIIPSQSERSPFAVPLIAEMNNEPVAALMIFIFASRAYYLFGMSRQVHRGMMPNYLLQWEAIKLARSLGCKQYDLWGAPDDFVEDDPLWGVFRFKVGLGGSIIRTIGAWDFPVHPLLYKLYTQLLPKVMGLMRFGGKLQTRRSFEN
jgi:peptidoglycan pentaglycine glycine transferase (the first glycine)